MMHLDKAEIIYKEARMFSRRDREIKDIALFWDLLKKIPKRFLNDLETRNFSKSKINQRRRLLGVI